MTKEGKKKKFDRKAYMRDYMKKYNQTDDGKKKKQEINANYQKSEKGKETRKKWLAKNPESVQKSSEKYRKSDKWKEAQKRTTERVAILIRQGYAGAIKALRSDLDLTQTQASEETGVPVATIRQTERGAVYLSEERLKEYANNGAGRVTPKGSTSSIISPTQRLSKKNTLDSDSRFQKFDAGEDGEL